MEEQLSQPTSRFPWKLAIFLWLLSVFASFLVLPFTLSLLPEAVAQAGGMQQVVVQTLISSLILYALATLGGLFFAQKTGFEAPFAAAWIQGSPTERSFRKTVTIALIAGVLVGILLIVTDIFVFNKGMLSLVNQSESLGDGFDRPPPWQGFFAAISAGITEEVLFRLLFVSFLVWLGQLLTRTRSIRPPAYLVWIAIVLVAVLFGLAHLPATQGIGFELTPLVVTRAIVLNGMGGILFGWLYWKHGLESAMLAHFSTDVVLHVLFPLILMI